MADEQALRAAQQMLRAAEELARDIDRQKELMIQAIETGESAVSASRSTSRWGIEFLGALAQDLTQGLAEKEEFINAYRAGDALPLIVRAVSEAVALPLAHSETAPDAEAARPLIPSGIGNLPLSLMLKHLPLRPLQAVPAQWDALAAGQLTGLQNLEQALAADETDSAAESEQETLAQAQSPRKREREREHE